MKTKDLEEIADDVVLEDSQLICALTKKIKAANEKELTLQSMIMMLNEEYNFDLKDMERDFPFSYEDDEGKTKRAKADLAVFETGKAHELDNMIRIAVVFDSKVKDKDPKKGVTETLGTYLEYTDCEFGVWTNGNDLHYLQCERDNFGQVQTTDISDFPGEGQTWDNVIEPRATFDDIDEATVKKFLRKADETGRLPDIDELSIPKLLEKLRLAENGQLKRGAIVLFGKDRGRFYPNTFVKIGKFEDDDFTIRFQELEEGNIIQVLDKDRFSEEQLKQLGLNERQIKAVLYVKKKERLRIASIKH